MGKTKLHRRTKKQQKYYRHLARQSQKKMSTQVDKRRVVLKEKPISAKEDEATKEVLDKVHSDDAISINASDNDFK